MCIRKNGHHPTPFCGSLGCPSTKEGDSHNHVVPAREFNLTIHFKSLRGLAMLSPMSSSMFWSFVITWSARLEPIAPARSLLGSSMWCVRRSMQQVFLRAHGSLIRFPGQDSVRHFLLSNWKLVGMGEGLHFTLLEYCYFSSLWIISVCI